MINFFFHLAEEVRGHMASMGFRSIEEMVGRAATPRAGPLSRRTPLPLTRLGAR